MKVSKILFILFLFVVASLTVYATSSLMTSILSTPGTTRTLDVPAAAENAHVISLGTAIDEQSGKTVEGYMFIYKKDFAKPDHAGGPKDKKDPKETICYEYLASGANWKSPEPYMIDPTNAAGLDPTVVENIIDTAIGTWDTEVSLEIFGSRIPETVDGADLSSPDGKNEVFFADISYNGAIGVTTVWGIFRGKPADRLLVEWDMVFDDKDFDWSAEAAGVAGKMDLLNIAAHEVGHALGLGHPKDICIDETMFRYASENEIKKRDLNTGDIDGVNSLY